MDAATQTNNAVLNAAGPFRAASVYEQVSQPMALAVQDSIDHLRSVSALSTASIGVGLAFIAAMSADDTRPARFVADVRRVTTRGE